MDLIEPSSTPPPGIGPWRAIACFFVAFGLCTLAAVAFTADGAGQVVNAVCGVVFLGVAAVFGRMKAGG